MKTEKNVIPMYLRELLEAKGFAFFSWCVFRLAERKEWPNKRVFFWKEDLIAHVFTLWKLDRIESAYRLPTLVLQFSLSKCLEAFVYTVNIQLNLYEVCSNNFSKSYTKKESYNLNMVVSVTDFCIAMFVIIYYSFFYWNNSGKCRDLLSNTLP